jgi:hypothetical protein
MGGVLRNPRGCIRGGPGGARTILSSPARAGSTEATAKPGRNPPHAAPPTKIREVKLHSGSLHHQKRDPDNGNLPDVQPQAGRLAIDRLHSYVDGRQEKTLQGGNRREACPSKYFGKARSASPSGIRARYARSTGTLDEAWATTFIWSRRGGRRSLGKLQPSNR